MCQPPPPTPPHSLPASSWLACYAFCGCVLWLRLLSLRHFDCRRGSWRFHIDFCCVPLIEFPRCCCCYCFRSTKFFNQKKLSLKPSVANDRLRKCFNSQRPHEARTQPLSLSLSDQRQSKVSNACNVQRLLAWLSFYFSLGWRTRITWSAPTTRIPCKALQERDQTGHTNGACIPWLVSVQAKGKPSRRHENWRLPNINKKRR